MYADNDEDEVEVITKKRKLMDTKAKKTKKNTPKTIPEQPKTDAVAPIMPDSENISPENCLVPMFPQDDQDTMQALQTTQQNSVVNNQLKTASNMFQNATFNNCNFTFQLPK